MFSLVSKKSVSVPTVPCCCLLALCFSSDGYFDMLQVGVACLVKLNSVNCINKRLKFHYLAYLYPFMCNVWLAVFTCTTN
jgi:hypothetical protein